MYSTITDSPLFEEACTLGELKKYTKEEEGNQGLRCLPSALERAHKKGTCSMFHLSLVQAISDNRAGTNGTQLSSAEFIKRFLVLKKPKKKNKIKTNKLVIEYDSMLGDVMPDGKVQKYVDDTIIMLGNAEQINLKVGSVVLFDAFRVAIHDERIDYRDVTVHFGEKDYKLDKNARMNNWPVGLCDVYDDILDKLVV